MLDGGGRRLRAFHGRAADVELSGLTVQDYDTMDPPDSQHRAKQIAALDVPDGRDWQLIDLTVQRIGGRGVSMNPGMHILRGRYVDNGHIGLGGRAARPWSRAPRSRATTSAGTARTGRAAATRTSAAIFPGRCR